MGTSAVERERPGRVRGHKLPQHEPPEQFGEHEHRQEEGRLRSDPALAVSRKSSAGHDHVHMRMVGHAEPQVWSTAVMPMLAPRCLGLAAIVRSVSDEALSRRS
jgi:hypothetical protein